MQSRFTKFLWPTAQGRHPARAALGGLVGVALSGLCGLALTRSLGGTVWLVPPIGASAVLVFAVTASPLAQPRAVLGGNIVSAMIGLAMACLVPVPVAAAALAVALAILAMQMLRCLHPPGGAAALLTALVGRDAAVHGWLILLAVIALNSLVLVLAAWAFNTLTGSRYPHRAEDLPELRQSFVLAHDRADLQAVLDELEDLPDIAIEDLDAIIRAVNVRGLARRADFNPGGDRRSAPD